MVPELSQLLVQLEVQSVLIINRNDLLLRQRHERAGEEQRQFSPRW